MILYNIHPRDMNINISFEIINTNKYTAPSAYIRTTQRALPCFSYILNMVLYMVWVMRYHSCKMHIRCVHQRVPKSIDVRSYCTTRHCHRRWNALNCIVFDIATALIYINAAIPPSLKAIIIL